MKIMLRQIKRNLIVGVILLFLIFLVCSIGEKVKQPMRWGDDFHSRIDKQR